MFSGLPARTFLVLLLDANARVGLRTEENEGALSIDYHVGPCDPCRDNQNGTTFRHLLENHSVSANNTHFLQATRPTDTKARVVTVPLRSACLTETRFCVTWLLVVVDVFLDLRCPAAPPRRLT